MFEVWRGNWDTRPVLVNYSQTPDLGLTSTQCNNIILLNGDNSGYDIRSIPALGLSRK